MKVEIQVPTGGPVTETVWVTLSNETGDWRVTRVEGEVLDEHNRTHLLEMAVAFVSLRNVSNVRLTLHDAP